MIKLKNLILYLSKKAIERIVVGHDFPKACESQQMKLSQKLDAPVSVEFNGKTCYSSLNLMLYSEHNNEEAYIGDKRDMRVGYLNVTIRNGG